MPLLSLSSKTIHPTILLITILLTLATCQISMLKHYQSKHALSHVIKNLRQGSLQSMDSNYDQKCTINSVCCLCQKNFKNASFLELHMQLQHPIHEETPEDQMLGYVFDKRINSEFRFQVCTKLLAIYNITELFHIHHTLSSSEKHNNTSQNHFLTPLRKPQIIDTCTIIAYGAYHQPLWRVWIKGTLIFAFVVVFIVYYASVADEVGDKYFKKKKDKVDNRIPDVIKEMY